MLGDAIIFYLIMTGGVVVLWFIMTRRVPVFGELIMTGGVVVLWFVMTRRATVLRESINSKLVINFSQIMIV